jgi:hypothetical protein
MRAYTIHPTYDIQRVREVRPCDGGTQLVFLTGLSVCLWKEHPEYERILHQARSSLQYGAPVGLMTGETGELVELNYTHQSAVRHVRPDEDDPSRLMVEFWAYSPICYLTKDHPEFERIKHTLERAATMDEQVLVANHMRMVEGETETWWKIMDVRPT